jgi:hypothetical protein
MLLIYDDPTARKEMLPEDWKALAAADHRYRREMPAKGVLLLGSHVLELPKDALTLSFDKGEVTSVPGPAVDTKEWLAGCYLIECDNGATAAEIAGHVPMPDGCGRVEVRPVMEQSYE